MAPKGKNATPDEFSVGDHVKILSGDFINAEGTVSDITDEGKVIVKVGKKIFGARCRPFRYSPDNLEYLGRGGPCADPPT